MKKSQLLILATSALLLAGCNTYRENMGYARQVSFNQLPAAAQNTVRNAIGDRPIARIDEDTKYGEPAYRVEVEMSGPNATVWVSPDGSIITESRRLASHRQVNEAAGAQSQPPANNQAPSTR